ncbi:MAG: type II glyceraldehyde-3-phosphate dehydrogenase [Chloroflexi bacterium]|nr:type II glyceraldehyde-3-phosphate dehydrogenase [Chloroflexota bacterium]
MSISKVRVAVNGYDLVGQYISDAVAAQEDMELVGVAENECATQAKAAIAKGYNVFASTPEAKGIPVAGDLPGLLRQADIVADVTAVNVNSPAWMEYRSAGVKVVYQSNTHYSLAGHSFVAQANYGTALGRDRTQVISSASTAIVRTLGALQYAGLLKKARGTLIGHAAAQCALQREVDVPAIVFSREGCDAQTVLCDVDVVTTSVGAAHSTCQLHTWNVELTRPVEREEVLDVFEHAPRVIFLNKADRVTVLNRPCQPRERMWDVGLWVESVAISGRDLFYTYEVYDPATVIVETIDAIRALMGNETDATASITKTNQALDQAHKFIPHSDWEI